MAFSYAWGLSIGLDEARDYEGCIETRRSTWGMGPNSEKPVHWPGLSGNLMSVHLAWEECWPTWCQLKWRRGRELWHSDGGDSSWLLRCCLGIGGSKDEG